MVLNHISIFKMGSKRKSVYMSIIPQGENLRKALKWISEERERCPNKKMSTLIDEACLRFDLQPNDGEFIMRFYQKESGS
jgi:hypothetical protein